MNYTAAFPRAAVPILTRCLGDRAQFLAARYAVTRGDEKRGILIFDNNPEKAPLYLIWNLRLVAPGESLRDKTLCNRLHWWRVCYWKCRHRFDEFAAHGFHPGGRREYNRVKPKIIFAHTVCPSQFSDLCEYLNESGLADAWYLTTPGNLERNKSSYRNLLPLIPDGNMMAANQYYYSGKVERSGRVGLGLYRALTEFMKKRKVDLVVAHGTLGSPHFIFDEFDVPVITYIEFPSYADYGWEPRYPPTEPQRLIDKNMQMLSYYEVIKSDRTLVPTEYARKMFPLFLQDKIVAQFEGMDPKKIARREPCGIVLPPNKQTLCFASRDLSSAKGLETFIATAAELQKRGEDIHFVVVGDAKATTYGYEQIFLERKYGKDKGVTFIEHLMRRHKIDRDCFTLTGKLPYAQYSDLLHMVDLFMYPVKYGSGNWGLVELLMRGRPVVAARRCYVPELIEDGVSGVLVDGDEPAAWAEEIQSLLADEQRREALGEAALSASRVLRLDEAAERYLSLFNEVITQYRAR